jgi:hypothetical protein
MIPEHQFGGLFYELVIDNFAGGVVHPRELSKL